MTSQVEAAWGLDAKSICLHCFPKSSYCRAHEPLLPLTSASPPHLAQRLFEVEKVSCLCGRQNINSFPPPKMVTFSYPETGYVTLCGKRDCSVEDLELGPGWVGPTSSRGSFIREREEEQREEGAVMMEAEGQTEMLVRVLGSFEAVTLEDGGRG